MRVTAQDIQSQQFHVRFRGFDIEEVDEFLERVAATITELSAENQRLSERVESMEKDLATFQNQQRAFQNTILSAQSLADTLKDKGTREAEEIVAEAQAEAERLLAQANEEVAALEREIDRLSSVKTQAHDELRQRLRDYMEMVEAGDPKPKPAVSYAKAAAAVSREKREQERRTTAPPLPPVSKPAEERKEETEPNDLYVKIDLPDDMLPPRRQELAAADLLDEGEEPVPDLAIPDLEGDMTFSLEDPLDTQGPAVSFGEEEEERDSKKRGGFNPNDSPF
ncbi:MAG: DivIVA domain-containing protein [Thermodesulfobacteriota bacterium]